MTDSRSIATAATMDAAWFAERLAEAGHSGVQVKSVAGTQIGTGQIGKCIRFDLTLAGNCDGVPLSFVGKFASNDPISRATGVQLKNYYREVNFYQHLAERLDIALPRCYFAEISGVGPEFALLLEDLSPAEQGDQLLGCSAEIADAAVMQLVGLQAPSWCDTSLEQYDWLTGATDESAESDEEALTTAGLYAQLLPGFIDRYGSALEEDERQIIARVASSPACPLFQPVGPVFCLEHVDYRLDNMLIDATQAPPRVTVVDWQSVRLGKPMNDVAYFLGAGLVPELRRESEQAIVSHYHDGLMAAGIEGFSWDECWQGYRRGTFSGFGVTVIASMIVQQTARGDQMFITMARRHARHALDLDCDEFLDD
jgi:hypothetical protein